MCVRKLTVMLLLISSAALAETWTESFDSGVGRLSETLGNGDDVFVYDAANQAIDASFVRNGAIDQRYVSLGNEFNVHTSKLIFSAIVRVDSFGSCSSIVPSDCFGFIGFMNSTSGNDQDMMGLRLFNGGGSARRIRQWGKYGDGTNVGSSSEGHDLLTFGTGQTFLIQGFLDGPSHVFSLTGYVLSGDSFALVTSKLAPSGTRSVSLESGRCKQLTPRAWLRR